MALDPPLVFPTLASIVRDIPFKLALALPPLLTIASAVAVGGRLLHLFGVRDRGGTRILFAAALGLGAVALGVLGLGLLGVASRWAVGGLLLAGLLCGWRECAHAAGEVRKRLRLPQEMPRALLIGLGALLVVTQFIVAFTPSLDYDDLEYHLGAPAEYLREGRVRFLPHNVYANFPENMEMLTMGQMALVGDPVRGAYSGRVLNTCLALLTALAVAALGRKFMSKTAADLAGVAYLSLPWLTVVSQKSYVEVGLTFYGFMALYAFYLWWKHGGRWLWLCGLMAGLAFGCKYTAFPYFVAPLGLAAVVGAMARAKNGRAQRPAPTQRIAGAAGSGLIFACAVLLPAAPWLAKNALATRNPVYPLAYSVFDGKHWDAEKDAKFDKAHSPKSVGPARMAAMARFLFFGQDPDSNSLGWPSPLLIAFIPFLALRRRNAGPPLALLGFSVLGFATWFFLTHQLARFYVPMLPPLCLATAAGLDPLIGRNRPGLVAGTVCGVLLFWSVLLSATILLTPQTRDARMGPAGLALGDEDGRRAAVSNIWPCIDSVNNLPPESKVLFVGEAQTFYYRRPVVYAVVFDTHPLEVILARAKTAEDVRDRLREMGVTHILINYAETARLALSYRYKSPATGRERFGYFFPGHEGWAHVLSHETAPDGRRFVRVRRWWRQPGPALGRDWQLFGTFLQAHCRPPRSQDTQRYFHIFEITPASDQERSRRSATLQERGNGRVQPVEGAAPSAPSSGLRRPGSSAAGAPSP